MRRPIGDPTRRGDWHAMCAEAGGWTSRHRVDVWAEVRPHLARVALGLGAVCSVLGLVVVL